MNQSYIEVDQVTGSTVDVHYLQIDTVQLGLQRYYKYQVQYRVNTSSVWVGGLSVLHDPDVSSTKEIEVTDLKGYTHYDVRIRSLRVLREMQDTTSVTPDVTFRTECGGG